MSIISKFYHALLDFLFPKNQKVVELESLTSGQLIRILPQAEHLNDESTLTIFDYKHALVKELIWELKYNGNKTVADKLGEIVLDTLKHDLAERNLFERFDSPILVPVPMSDKRRNERGWNQAEVLSEAVVKHDSGKIFKYLPRQLVKFRHTESQTKTSSKRERLDNLRDSMRVLNSSLVHDKCVILLDDVMTTGATFSEAKRALRQAGAKKIICIAVAH